MAAKKRGIPKQAAFLAAFIATASVTKAAKAARIDRALHYRWLDEDPDYPAKFKTAAEQAADVLESEAVRRAHEGVDEPLVYQGRFTYKQRPLKNSDGDPVLGVDGKPRMEDYGKPLAVRKYSDGLLQFLLKGFRPDKYRERVSAELAGPGGGPIPIEGNPALKTLSDDELAAAIALARKLAPAPAE